MGGGSSALPRPPGPTPRSLRVSAECEPHSSFAQCLAGSASCGSAPSQGQWASGGEGGGIRVWWLAEPKREVPAPGSSRLSRRAGRAAGCSPGKGAEGPGDSPKQGKISFLNPQSLCHRGLGSPWDPETPGKRGHGAWPSWVCTGPPPPARGLGEDFSAGEEVVAGLSPQSPSPPQPRTQPCPVPGGVHASLGLGTSGGEREYKATQEPEVSGKRTDADSLRGSQLDLLGRRRGNPI